MRIALVSPYDLSAAGGVQTHLVGLAAALRAAGEEVLLIGAGGGGPVDPGADRYVGLGPTLRMPANGSRAPIALAPRTIGRTRAVLRDAEPDVVHIHEPLVPLIGPVATLAAGAPTVLTFHAFAEAGLLRPLYRAVRPLGRHLLRHAGALTAVSPAAAEFHAQALGIPPARFSIVPNGVDVARFAPAAPDAGRRDLLFVGRLEPRKGADVALAAFTRLAPARPALRLRIVGEGPQGEALRAQAASAPAAVAERIEFLGRLSQAELPHALASAAVVLAPARGGESFGIVLLEAMAAGAPLVASGIAGYRAVARHEVEALLSAPGDPVQLAAAVERMLDDEDLRTRLVAHGRIRAQEHDWASIAARMRVVYAQVT